MFLGKTVVHGLYALCYLSRRDTGQVTSSVEVSDALGIPPEHARKVLTALTDAELVSSTRGRLGGYALAKRTEDITMLEVLDALNPGAGLAALESRPCPMASGDTCCVQPGLAELREELRAVFAARTLASVIGEECAPVPSHARSPDSTGAEHVRPVGPGRV